MPFRIPEQLRDTRQGESKKQDPFFLPLLIIFQFASFFSSNSSFLLPLIIAITITIIAITITIIITIHYYY